jgi:aminopeptidase N
MHIHSKRITYQCHLPFDFAFLRMSNAVPINMQQLADVIAHEIAHSWTGNLVTNSTWEHFWLNEGWTVWLERKIMARVKHSTDFLKLSAQVRGR